MRIEILDSQDMHSGAYHDYVKHIASWALSFGEV